MRRFGPFFLIVVCSIGFVFAQSTGPSATSTSKATSPPATNAVSAPANGAEFTPDLVRQLIQTVTDNDQANDKKSRDYTYIQREEDRHLDGDGKVKKTESTTSEVLIIYGSEVDKEIAKDDKPLSEKEAKKEDEKIQKIIDKRKNESEHDRQKRLEKEEKDREEGRKWVGEISDAFNFRMVGTKAVDGRDTYVIDGEPRPGFKPHLKYANYLPKFKFRVWIDKADLEVAKLDAEAIDNLSWGLFVARLHKGAHFQFEATRVNDEVWLPKHFAVRMSARVLLLKNFNMEVDTTYRDYKKFRTESKILGMTGPVQ
jgi:hypothetical protein